MSSLSASYSNLEEYEQLKQYRFFIEEGKSFDIKYGFRSQKDVKQNKQGKQDKKKGKKSKKENKIENQIQRKKMVQEKQQKQIEKVKKQLKQLTESTLNLDIKHCSIGQALYSSWQQRFPIAILFFNFSGQIKPFLKSLLTDKFIVQSLFNQYFRLCCTSIQKYKLQKWIQPFINVKQDEDHLIIARVNIRDEIQIITKICLRDIELEKFKKDVKSAKTQSIQRQMDQMHIVKEFNEIRKGNRHYQRPRPIKQKLMIRQDMKLINQQDLAFFKACKPSKNNHNPQQQTKKQIKVSKQVIKKQRQQRMQKLTKYEVGLHCKIRLPSGKNFLLTLSQNETIDYLFKYIDSIPEDIGFQNDQIRHFDIIRIDEPKSLIDKRNLKIKDILSENEVLQIKEIQA